MSTVQKVNLEPCTDVLPLWKKDLPLADKTLADPLNALALVDGEWMVLNSSYQWVRAADVSGAGNAATLRSFVLWNERGRSDRLGMADRKTTCLFRGEFEADTRIYDAAAVVGSGAAIASVMQPLKVASITIGSRVYAGLVGHGGSADTSPVIGYVTRLPSSNGGKLRFISGYRS
jgi:hypothetical protein